MSRETKVGLLVSCSFLCLVGVVVVCKLQRGGPPGDQVASAAASEEKLDPEPSSSPAPANPSGPGGDGGKSAPTAAAPVPGNKGLEPAGQLVPLKPVPPGEGPSPIQPTAAVEGDAGPPAPPPPPPSAFWNQPPSNSPGHKTNGESGSKPAPELMGPPPPEPAAGPMPVPPPTPAALPPTVKPTAKTRPEATPAPEAPPMPFSTAAPEAASGKGSEEKPSQAEGHPVGEKAPKATPLADKGTRTTVVPAVPEPEAPAAPAAPAEKATPPAPPPPPVSPSAVPVAGPAMPAEPTPVAQPRAETGANLGKPVPAAGATAGQEKAEPPLPAAPHMPAPVADDAPPQPRVKLGTPAGPPAEQVAEGPPPVRPAPSRPLPPVGAVPAATSPPLVAPVPAPEARPPAPQVESFNEEEYRWRAGDTFESLSRAKYQTPRYAQALLEYNRAHPIAGDDFQAGVTAPQVGRAVYIPPAAILEKRFGNVITGPATPSYSSPAAPTRGAAPSAGPAYRVGARGEYLRAVAMRALGDSERWQEVLRLNPSVSPAYPVPPGSVLRLPADARVPSENTP